MVGHSTNMACHHFYIDIKATVAVEHLPSLEAEYCRHRPNLCTKYLDKIFEIIRNNIHWKYMLIHEKEDGKYIPGLYIRSTQELDNASEEIEESMNCHKNKIRSP